MVAESSESTKLIRSGLLPQFGWKVSAIGLGHSVQEQRVERWRQRPLAENNCKEREKVGEEGRDPGIALSCFKKARGGGPAEEGQNLRVHHGAMQRPERMAWVASVFGPQYMSVLTFFSHKSHLDTLGSVIPLVKITLSPVSQCPDICVWDDYDFCVFTQVCDKKH